MDYKLLADALVIFLTPALPYLLKAGDKATEEVGKKLGAGGWEKASKIWGRLRGRLDEEPMAKGAAELVVAEPEDEDARAGLRLQLRKILERDEALASEVGAMLEAAGSQPCWKVEVHGDGAAAVGNRAVAAGKGGTAIGGDVHGDVVIGVKQRGE